MENNSKAKNTMLDLEFPKRNKFSAEQITALVVVLIPLFGYLVFQIFPLIISFMAMFSDMDHFDVSTMRFNNFENFAQIFSDEIFWKSLLVSFICTCAQMISLLVSLIISTLLHQKTFGHKVFQVLFFIPYICSSVAVSIIFAWMFDVNFGIVNTLTVALFGEAARVNWFANAGAYLVMLMTVIIWQCPGYGIVMYKAAYGTLNPSLYEAASVDGAGPLRKFFKITLPDLGPTTFYLFISGIIAGMQTFDIAKMIALLSDPSGLTAGPHNWGMTTILYIYQVGISASDMGRASVMSWFLFAIMLVVSIINFKVRNKGEIRNG